MVSLHQSIFRLKFPGSLIGPAAAIGRPDPLPDGSHGTDLYLTMQGVAAAFGLANLAGTVVAWRILSRRMRGLYGRLITISLVRMHLAAIPGAIFALAVSFSVGVIFSPGPAFGIITVIIGGSGALLLYVAFFLYEERITTHPSDEGCKKYLGVDKCPPFRELPWW